MLCNFRGRLLNDIIGSMITTSYEEKMMASSAKSVGEVRLGQVTKCMVQSEFQYLAGTEAVGLFGSHSGLAVEALDDAARRGGRRGCPERCWF